MKVKKLDKRFRLCKEGKAAFYADLEWVEFGKVNTIMIAAYGMSGSVSSNSRLGTKNRDWYYQHKRQVITRRGIEPGGGNSSLRYLDQQSMSYWYRIFFRREEQAMYLTLAMAHNEKR